MESFYGGRQGASFVIKGSFKYITDKKHDNGDWVDPYYGQAWYVLHNWANIPDDRKPINKKSGQRYTEKQWEDQLAESTMTIKLNDSNYKDIWYGEHCIIDPDNKNNKNNGKIFRRTLKGAGDEDLEGNCAEYIGQIVGPAGPTPHLKAVKGVDANEEDFDNDSLALNFDDTIEYINKNGDFVKARTDVDADQDMYVHSLMNDIKLIPGSKKRKNGSTTDVANRYHLKKTNSGTIVKPYLQQGGYNWYNLRINTSTDDISEIHVGMDVPYYVVDLVQGKALPDVANPSTRRTINTDAAPQGEAPFYEAWAIDVPRGLRGAWFDNIKVIKRVSGTNYYTVDKIEYIEPTETTEDKYQLKTNATTVSTTSWPVGAEGWVATFHWRAQGAPLNVVNDIPNIYLGMHRDIKDITFDEEGTLKIFYSSWGGTYPETQEWLKQVDWIKKIGVDKNPSVDYTIDTNSSTLNASAITKGDNLKITFNNDTVEGATGIETVDGKARSVYSKNLKTIAGIKTFDDGTLRVYRSDGTMNNFEKRINWISSAQVTATNTATTTGDTLKINFNNNNIANISKNLRLINSITLADNGILTIKHSDGSIRASEGTGNSINLGSRLNWIQEIYRLTSNDTATYYSTADPVPPHHLLVRYNNTTPGQTSGRPRVRFKNRDDWYDLGVVQEILDGLYFNDSAVNISYTQNQSGYDDAYDYAKQWLNNSNKYGQGTPDIEGRHLGQKALVGTINTKDRNGNLLSTETVVFYYDNGNDTGANAGWQVLGQLSSTASSATIDGTNQVAAQDAIKFKTTTIVTNSLDNVWVP